MIQIRGSQWRKWDLHFHTPSSYDYDDMGISNEKIIDELVRQQISVVAITDHHVMDVPRIRELQQLGKKRDVTVLPGIEFLSEIKGSEPIHYIGIFPENSDIEFIWPQIENRTNISRVRGESKKLNEVYCDLNDTISLIKEHGGLVTIHAGSKSNSIDKITNSLDHARAQKEDIAKIIDIFEIGKESDLEGYNKHVIPFVLNKCGKHIPIVICSDSHNIGQYSLKQNLWIKGDPSFSGLKQILYEPTERVKIQFSEPDFKEERLIIDSVRFLSSNNTFTTEPIFLNKNLNVIIGGKSSGKSILLYNIARTLIADQNFFAREGLVDKYKFREYDNLFNFEITTAGGFTQKLYRPESENSILPEIRYIPQNYLVKLAEPEGNKKGDALNKMVRELLNEDVESKSIYDEFIFNVKANDRKRDGMIDMYFQLKDKISVLKTDLKSKSSIAILEHNIAANLSKVTELNKKAGMSEAEITKYNDLQVQLRNENSEFAKAGNDLRKVSEFVQETSDTFMALSHKRDLLLNSLSSSPIIDIFKGHYVNIEEVMQKLTQFSEMLELVKVEDGKSRFKNASVVSELFSEINQRRAKLTEELKPYAQNEEIKKQIEVLNKSIEEDRKSLHAIVQLTKELNDNVKALSAEKEAIFKLYIDNYNKYIELIDKLKERTDNLEKDGLKISGLVKFNFVKFKNEIFDVSDGRTASYTRFPVLFGPSDSLANFNMDELVAELRKMFEAIVENEDYVLSKRAEKKAVSKMLLNDHFFDYWQIEYKGDKLGEMSTGKASFVILMLIIGLSRSKAPILIDQPEDNLDNRSITTELVTYLRDKKLERQIILVTHNPNVVVNADAENIIVAHQKGQNHIDSGSPFRFDYINGALENSFIKILKEGSEKVDILKSMGIKEHIAEIVEGGKEAFKRRERKYGFS